MIKLFNDYYKKILIIIKASSIMSNHIMACIKLNSS